MKTKTPKQFDWRQYLERALARSQYMALSTVDSHSGTWVNPVYFTWDDQFNLYFISMPASRHMENIATDPRAAVAIFSTDQNTHSDVLGLQLHGTAEFLKGKLAIRKAHHLYNGRVFAETHKETYWKLESFLVKKPEWLFVKITPEHFYCFDTATFGEERQEIPLGTF